MRRAVRCRAFGTTACAIRVCISCTPGAGRSCVEPRTYSSRRTDALWGNEFFVPYGAHRHHGGCFLAESLAPDAQGSRKPDFDRGGQAVGRQGSALPSLRRRAGERERKATSLSLGHTTQSGHTHRPRLRSTPSTARRSRGLPSPKTASRSCYPYTSSPPSEVVVRPGTLTRRRAPSFVAQVAS